MIIKLNAAPRVYHYELELDTDERIWLINLLRSCQLRECHVIGDARRIKEFLEALSVTP